MAETSSWRRGPAGAAALALALAAPAAAAPGNGVRLGGSEGRIHPFLEVEARYDSNVYLTEDREQVGDVVVHVRPGFDLAVPGDLAAVELGGSLDWAHYLGLDASETSGKLSKLYGQASLGLRVNRRGTVGLELDDEFRRAQGTTALVLTNAVVSNTNALRVRVPVRPGGGALVFAVTGGWTLETFEDYFDAPLCAGCPSSAANLGYDELRAGGELRWRFLPRTAAIVQGGWFQRDQRGGGASGAAGWQAQAGVSGLVTTHLAATVEAGYSSTLDVAQGDLASWLATVELEWLATDRASAKAGWTHSLGIDPGPSPYTADRLLAGGRILLGGRTTARLDASWESRAYERIRVGAAPAGAVSADVLRVEPSLETALARWLSVAAGYAFGKRTSSLDTTLPGFSYSKSEAWLRVAVRY